MDGTLVRLFGWTRAAGHTQAIMRLVRPLRHARQRTGAGRGLPLVVRQDQRVEAGDAGRRLHDHHPQRGAGGRGARLQPEPARARQPSPAAGLCRRSTHGGQLLAAAGQCRTAPTTSCNCSNRPCTIWATRSVGLLRADSGFFDEAVLLRPGRQADSLYRRRPADPAAAADDLPSLRLVGAGDRVGADRAVLPSGRMGDGTAADRGASVGQTQNGTRQDAVAVCGRPGHSGLALWRVRNHACNLPMAEVWRTYRGRADCENRIKELKADFGLDAFNMRDFWATEAALGLGHARLQPDEPVPAGRVAFPDSRTRSRRSTAWCLAVGGSWHQDASQNRLMLSVPRRKRAWFAGALGQCFRLRLSFMAAKWLMDNLG
jgi:hypothetical protein